MINELRKLSVGAQAAKLTDTEDIQRARRISMENMEIFSPNRLKNKVKCFSKFAVKLDGTQKDVSIFPDKLSPNENQSVFPHLQ